MVPVEDMPVNAPEQSADDGPLALVGFDRQQANLDRANSGSFQDAWIGKPAGDRKRGPIVQRDHADDPPVADRDEVHVLLVEFVDEPSVAWILVLRDLADKRRMVQGMDLVKLARLVRPLERIATDLKHRDQERVVNGSEASRFWLHQLRRGGRPNITQNLKKCEYPLYRTPAENRVHLGDNC